MPIGTNGTKIDSDRSVRLFQATLLILEKSCWKKMELFSQVGTLSSLEVQAVPTKNALSKDRISGGSTLVSTCKVWLGLLNDEGPASCSPEGGPGAGEK